MDLQVIHTQEEARLRIGCQGWPCDDLQCLADLRLDRENLQGCSYRGLNNYLYYFRGCSLNPMLLNI